jgi:hypothetical protein
MITNASQVRLAEDEHLIQALAAQCANQTFHIAILPGRSRRDRPIPGALGVKYVTHPLTTSG